MFVKNEGKSCYLHVHVVLFILITYTVQILKLKFLIKRKLLNILRNI